MNRLDEHVRRSLLRYPLIFTTRWDVLRHLYLMVGNGHEWVGGELVDVCDRDGFNEAKCRSEFFRDLDELAAKDEELRERIGADREDWPARDDRIRRARRQFQLDHIDLLVHEPCDRPRSFDPESVVAHASTDFSAAFTVPDDAEVSFKAGAVEVLGELIPGLYFTEMRGQDRGLRAAAARERERLAPVDAEAMRTLTESVLAELDAQPDR